MEKKIIIGIIIVILIAFCGIYAAIGGINILPHNDINVPSIDTSNLEVKDNIIINQTQSFENKWFTTDKSEVNTVLIENNATADIKNSAINKTGDSTGNGDSTDFYGTNAAVLVKKGSTANINGLNIFTNSTGSNAIFVTMPKTLIINKLIIILPQPYLENLMACLKVTISQEHHPKEMVVKNQTVFLEEELVVKVHRI